MRMTIVGGKFSDPPEGSLAALNVAGPQLTLRNARSERRPTEALGAVTQRSDGVAFVHWGAVGVAARRPLSAGGQECLSCPVAARVAPGDSRNRWEVPAGCRIEGKPRRIRTTPASPAAISSWYFTDPLAPWWSSRVSGMRESHALHGRKPRDPVLSHVRGHALHGIKRRDPQCSLVRRPGLPSLPS